MKKALLTMALVATIFSSTAHASERITVNDIHNFVSRMNAAVNSFNLNNGRNELENMISNQAVFEDNVNQHQHNRHWVSYDYDYGYGYRYPYYENYANVGFSSMDKWEKISALRTKKRTVAGYRGMFDITNTLTSPVGDSAVVDVDFKEESVTYAPHYYGSRYSQTSKLRTNSKCKMNLGKVNNTVYLTRLYCNTSTNLPF